MRSVIIPRGLVNATNYLQSLVVNDTGDQFMYAIVSQKKTFIKTHPRYSINATTYE